MKKHSTVLLMVLLATIFFNELFAQAAQPVYNVTAGNGNGLRFWSSDNYKIHMGNTSTYRFGPVTDYSIKFNMTSSIPGRGWTWGPAGAEPSAALNVGGTFRIKGTFIYGGNLESSKTDYTKIQLTTHDWSGSHGLLFNAYQNITMNGGLATTGNTKYANDASRFGSGAGAIMFFGNGGAMDFMVSPASTGKDTDVNWGMSKMRILRNGNIGMGTLTPTHKLEVNGSIRSKEIIVETTSWPDYVFEKEYDLKPLEILENYISENSHLPNIPSAKEITKNGVKVGEMNVKLLEKIEELTLYTIQQEKEIKKQQEKLIFQEEKFQTQEKLIKELLSRLDKVESKILKNK